MTAGSPVAENHQRRGGPTMVETETTTHSPPLSEYSSR